MNKADHSTQAPRTHRFPRDKVAQPKPRQNYPLIVSVASGKGGVGKTLTTVNFALSACQMGAKVLILDGDLGLANVDVVLGLRAKYNIKDVFAGHVSLADIILDGPCGVRIIPSGSGITSLHTLSYMQRKILGDELASLDEDFDLLLIDAGAGIGPNVLDLAMASHRRVIVSTCEPHAITDAYALVKVLASERRLADFDLLINMAHSAKEAQAVAQNFVLVAERFLGVSVRFLGFVPRDESVPDALMRTQLAHPRRTSTLAGHAWAQIAHKLIGESTHKQRIGNISMQAFWSNFVGQESGAGVALAAT